MLKYFKIKDEKELDLLRNKDTAHNKLNFSFPQDALAQLKILLRAKNSIQLLVKNDKKIVAYVAVAENLENFPNSLFISEIFVNPPYQKQGIGKNLLKRLITFAKKKRLSSIIAKTGIENFLAQRFYEKNNFIKIGKSKRKEEITYQLILA